jgi:hypothetical protein
MKRFLIISLIFSWASVFAQEAVIINLVFKDTTNFDLTRTFGDNTPTEYFVLTQTDCWNSQRFKLKENVKSTFTRKRLSRDEHHPYNHTYLFRDKALDKLFSDSEKEYLFAQTKAIPSRELTMGSINFSLVKSFETVKNGFFFSITDPIFTTNKDYAFIDIHIYHKDEASKGMNDSYFGKILLIYQNIKTKGWTQIEKIDHLIL